MAIRSDSEALWGAEKIKEFAMGQYAVAWCTYTAPFFPGSHVQAQFVRILYYKHNEYRTAEYSRPATAESRQLCHVEGTQAPTTIDEFESLYAEHGITWRP